MGVYGRRRYYSYQRNGAMVSDTSYPTWECPDTLPYAATLQYQPWMDGATLALRTDEYTCCNKVVAQSTETLGAFEEFVPWIPQQAFMATNVPAVKSREIEGQAFIDFVVNKTDIRPDYRRNAFELAKIKATIDSISRDKDITLSSVWLKGYASPEGAYNHNATLAEGRTQALSEYIQRLYEFPVGVINTEYEAEDWTGLRTALQGIELPHRDQIIEIIDSQIEPDAKDAKIKKLYPQEYLTLLREVYPGLRHTDYKVQYVIREYTSPEEIAKIMATAPQKLGLDEFYLLSQQYEPESAEYAEVIQTAVRMYPNDEMANLNAANLAMEDGDLQAAERYLSRAGQSAEAEYARGALAYLKGDNATAANHWRKSSLPQAQKALEQLAQ